MHYRFTQSLAISRQRFPLGIQEVSAEVEAHPDFLFFVKAGWIQEVDPSELVTKQPRRAEVRGAELAKKIAAKHQPKTEQVREGVHETPQQKAARTRRENAAKAREEKSEEKKGEEE